MQRYEKKSKNPNKSRFFFERLPLCHVERSRALGFAAWLVQDFSSPLVMSSVVEISLRLAACAKSAFMRSLHALRLVEMTGKKTVEMTKEKDGRDDKREKDGRDDKRKKTVEMTKEKDGRDDRKRRLGKLQNYKITITVRIFGKN